MGDPAGIGPEVTFKALASPKIRGLANFVTIGGEGRSFPRSKVDARCGKAAISYIDRALGLLKSGRADALVTAPVNKAAVRMAGVHGFEGHTEYLAEKTGSKNFAMMFVGKRLKVTLVTRHIPLSRVSSALSAEAIQNTILITHKYLKDYFGIRKPRIGVAGLNPHAGEGGLFGSEEERIIKPAVKKASKIALGVVGPVPPDVVFYECLNGRLDAVVSLYHDQGLVPFKMLYFNNGVNLTLGLPFVRTSPDHGTAFDIAGKNIADPTSMIEAIRLACRLTKSTR